MAKDKEKNAPRPGDETDDRWYTDVLQVAYTEAMPQIARRVWNKIPVGIRDSMTEEGSLWAFGMPIANALMERGLTKAWGGKYAGMNDFRRDLMAAVNQIRREETKKDGGDAKAEDKADAVALRGGALGVYVEADGKLHHPSCPDVPPEKEGKQGSKGKQGQPGNPPIPAVRHRRMTLEQAGKFSPAVPLHDRCRSLLEEEAKKAEPAKKKGKEVAADILDKNPTLAEKVFTFIANTYPGEQGQRYFQLVRLFLNSEAELRLLAQFAEPAKKAAFEGAMQSIEDSTPGARLAFALTRGVGGFFRSVFGQGTGAQQPAAQPGQATPPAGGTGQQATPPARGFMAGWTKGRQ